MKQLTCYFRTLTQSLSTAHSRLRNPVGRIIALFGLVLLSQSTVEAQSREVLIQIGKTQGDRGWYDGIEAYQRAFTLASPSREELAGFASALDSAVGEYENYKSWCGARAERWISGCDDACGYLTRDIAKSTGQEREALVSRLASLLIDVKTMTRIAPLMIHDDEFDIHTQDMHEADDFKKLDKERASKHPSESTISMYQRFIDSDRKQRSRLVEDLTKIQSVQEHATTLRNTYTGGA